MEKAGREYSQLKLQRDELSNERKSVKEMREGVVVLERCCILTVPPSTHPGSCGGGLLQ